MATALVTGRPFYWKGVTKAFHFLNFDITSLHYAIKKLHGTLKILGIVTAQLEVRPREFLNLK